MAVTNPNQSQKQLQFNMPLAPVANLQERKQSPYKTINFAGGVTAPIGRPAQSNGDRNYTTSSFNSNIGSQQWTPPPPPKPKQPNSQAPTLGMYDYLNISPENDPRKNAAYSSTLGYGGPSTWQTANPGLAFPTDQWTNQGSYWANSPQGDAVSRIQALNQLSTRGIPVPRYNPVNGMIYNDQGQEISMGDYLSSPNSAPYQQPSQNTMPLSPGMGFNPSVGIFGPQGNNVNSNFAGGSMNGLTVRQPWQVPQEPIQRPPQPPVAGYGQSLTNQQFVNQTPNAGKWVNSVMGPQPQSNLKNRKQSLSGILDKYNPNNSMQNNSNPEFLDWLMGNMGNSYGNFS